MNTNTNNNNNNNNETPTLLTEHHKSLYQHLEISTNFGFEVNVEMIARAFPHVYNFKSQKGNYSNCPLLYQHIDELNASNEIDKIIIKNNNKFKLGTEQEAIDYYNKMISKAMRLLVKASVVKRKISKHGQAKLIDNDFNYNDPLSFIETFITTNNGEKNEY